MKKNLRIVSAAAAALLAVAPVAASAVSVNADVVNPGGSMATETPSTPTTKGNVLTFSSTLNNVNASTKVSDLTSDANVMKEISVKSNNSADKASIVGVSKAVISDKKTGGTVQKELKAGNTYYLQAWVTVAGLQKKGTADNDENKYSSTTANFGNNDATPTLETHTTTQGTITNVKVAVEFKAVDPNAKGNPFFSGVENGTNERQTYSNGQNVPAPEGELKTVSDVKAAVKKMGLEAFNDSQDNTNRLTEAAVNNAIDSQLKDDKLIGTGDTVKFPAKGWTLKLSYTNPINGKTATLNVVFKGDKNAQYSAYPLILSSYAKNRDLKAMQGENHFDGMNTANVKLGTKDWASTVLKNFQAQQSSKNNSYLRLTTDNLKSSDINTNKPGLYNATLKATNSDGLTTELHFNIAVTGDVKDLVETKTVLGSTNEVVRLVDIVDGKTSYLSGEVVNQGQSINVYTNDTKTVDGVSYTRVAKPGVNREDNNEWIPTENVVESKKSQKTIMHAAYEYDANHKRVGTHVLGAYNTITVVGDKTQLADGTPVYKLENGNYVDARNIEATPKTLTHNAYVYKSNGKAYTYKKTVKKGKKHVKKTYKKVIKKGTSVDTFGAKFKKVGKMTNVYRIGKNQYIKAGNFGE